MKTIYNAILSKLNEINIPYLEQAFRDAVQIALNESISESALEHLKETKDYALSKASLYWFDWDKGQLKKKDDTGRYPVVFPCALVRIGIPSTTDVTDKVQDCKATVTITLAFDTLGLGRTAANAPEEVRAQGLEPYDVIADVYSRLQGYYTAQFNPLRRRSQGELTHPDLFVYQIVFETGFEDSTADT